MLYTMSENYKYSNFREWIYMRIDEETGKLSEEFIPGLSNL